MVEAGPGVIGIKDKETETEQERTGGGWTEACFWPMVNGNSIGFCVA